MKMRLDIDTPRGRANERHNEQCWAVIMRYFDLLDAKCQKLPKQHSADGVIRGRRDNKALMLVEVKSRHDCDEQIFWGPYSGEWLITNTKITDNVPLAKRNGVPFVGALHIVKSRLILLKQIWDGEIVCEHRVRRSTTQATINGGFIERENAYVPMHDSLRIPY
jgi:hypothetical protein